VRALSGTRSIIYDDIVLSVICAGLFDWIISYIYTVILKTNLYECVCVNLQTECVSILHLTFISVLTYLCMYVLCTIRNCSELDMESCL
jgi:hypothetical protein